MALVVENLPLEFEGSVCVAFNPQSPLVHASPSYDAAYAVRAYVAVRGYTFKSFVVA